jgi:hypothetical protein
VRSGERLNPGAFLAAARHLARDARASSGLVALSLVQIGGRVSGGDAAWREVLRALRRHADPDVAELALRVNTEQYWR